MDPTFIYRYENTLQKLIANCPQLANNDHINCNLNTTIDTAPDKATYAMHNRNATLEELKTHCPDYANYVDHHITILDKYAITLDMIENEPGFLAGYAKSYNPNLTLEFIRKHFNTKWDWYHIMGQHFITREFLDEHPELKVNYRDCIRFRKSRNYSLDLTFSHVKEHPSYAWNWRTLSKHPNITWNMIKSHPELPWNWEYVSRNPNITWNIILQNLDYPWCLHGFSFNPNITYDIIASKDCWNMDGLLSNEYRRNYIVYVRGIQACRVARRATFKKLIYATAHPVATKNVVEMIQKFI